MTEPAPRSRLATPPKPACGSQRPAGGGIPFRDAAAGRWGSDTCCALEDLGAAIPWNGVRLPVHRLLMALDDSSCTRLQLSFRRLQEVYSMGAAAAAQIPVKFDLDTATDLFKYLSPPQPLDPAPINPHLISSSISPAAS